MRRQRIFGFTAVVACALLLGNGIAAAQAQSQVPSPASPTSRAPQAQPRAPQAGPGGPSGPGSLDATAGITREVNISPQEELTQSESFLTRMDGSRTTVRQALEKARIQRDVVKTLCLNDKLNQLDVAIRSARERQQSLQAAVGRADSDLAKHEFTILSVLRGRADQLSAEANQCIGQEAGFVGESAVSFTVDTGIPADPSTFNDPNGNVIVEPPTCTSCIK